MPGGLRRTNKLNILKIPIVYGEINPNMSPMRNNQSRESIVGKLILSMP